jgi:hypothetical protein
MIPLIWFGPVSTLQARPTVPPGYELHVVNCVGDVRADFSRCSDVADRWRDADGRRLPALRKRLSLPDDARPFLAAYSAGGMCVRRLLVDPRDRAEIAGVYLADATYSERVNGAPRIVGDPLQEALVSFALECIADRRPLYVTTSSHVPGGGGPSASETAAALRGVIDAQQQERLGYRLGACELVDLAPGSAWGRERVMFVDFGGARSHAAHVLTIAPVLLPRVAG